MQGMSASRPARPDRRRASHSLDAVVGEAVAILDEGGESALTFRALAARLGGGVGSIYWYVANKDELLDRASDHVLSDVLDATARFTGGADPVEGVRGIAVALFDAVVRRPWLGSYFLRTAGMQPNGLRLYERLGQQVLRLGLAPREEFHAVSAVVGYVLGIAVDRAQQPPREVIDGTVTREEVTGRVADRWRSLDPDEFPFLHEIADEFERHDDGEQFRAGLDLLLAGLSQQAEDCRRPRS